MPQEGLMKPVMTLGEWNNLWVEDFIPFHHRGVHRLMEKNVDKLVAGRKSIKIFFPLCGKALDMKWLADRGHTIVGVESSENAIKQFFEETGEEYTIKQHSSGKFTVYYGKSGKFRMYVGNLFDFSSEVEGVMEGVWDRGSLVAINTDDRFRYAKVMCDLLAPDCRYLLVSYDYDQSVYPGPPKSLPEPHIKELYGEKCNVECLEYIEGLPTILQKIGAHEVQTCHTQLHLITPKEDQH